eukprot:457713-Pleurochrysis_carterae.AAC.1
MGMRRLITRSFYRCYSKTSLDAARLHAASPPLNSIRAIHPRFYIACSIRAQALHSDYNFHPLYDDFAYPTRQPPQNNVLVAVQNAASLRVQWLPHASVATMPDSFPTLTTSTDSERSLEHPLFRLQMVLFLLPNYMSSLNMLICRQR